MEKCGCRVCILVDSVKAITIGGHIVKNCPCVNCLIKVLCDVPCKDVDDYCKAHRKILMNKQRELICND